MTDYSFTNRPDLGAGVYGHHLLTQWNINQSAMLQSMHATGALNLRDFNINGVPLTGSILAAVNAECHVAGIVDGRARHHGCIGNPV